MIQGTMTGMEPGTKLPVPPVWNESSKITAQQVGCVSRTTEFEHFSFGCIECTLHAAGLFFSSVTYV